MKTYPTQNSWLVASLIAGFSAIALFPAHGDESATDTLITSPNGTLGGTSPTESGLTAAWQTASTWTTTATGATSYGNGGDAYLAIPTITNGGIYTLEVTESGGDGTNDVHMGFLDIESGNVDEYNESGPNFDINGGHQLYLYTGDGHAVGGQSENSEDTNAFKLVLDTTGPQWTITGYDNDSLIGTYNYSTPLSGLDGVNFAEGGTSAIFKSFSFTETNAPEPATWSFLVLGVGLLAFYLRRRIAV